MTPKWLKLPKPRVDGPAAMANELVSMEEIPVNSIHSIQLLVTLWQAGLSNFATKCPEGLCEDFGSKSPGCFQ